MDTEIFDKDRRPPATPRSSRPRPEKLGPSNSRATDVGVMPRPSHAKAAKNKDPRFLSTSTTMITGPDLNRHHRRVSALSLRSRRATTGGLWRPSESRALVAFPTATNRRDVLTSIATDATTPGGSKGHVHSRQNPRNAYIRLV